MTDKAQYHKRLKKRHFQELRFRFYAAATIILVLSLLGAMTIGIAWKGSSVLWKPFIKVEIKFDPNVIKIDPHDIKESLRHVDYRKIIHNAIAKQYPSQDLSRSQILKLFSPGAELSLYHRLQKEPQLIGKKASFWLLASDDVDYLMKHKRLRSAPEDTRRLNGQQIAFLDHLKNNKNLKMRFNMAFFTQGDSRSPELSGIYSSLVGSFYTLLVTLLLACPLGIGAAIYLEEFAPSNRFIRIIEININNLASVPSIIFGLLGLVVYINLFQLPRSSALVAGMTLALMVMPTIVIASRSALQTVPKAIRRAAEGLGASPVQVVFHHVLPLSLPGIVTGTILSIARAIGECAALLMIGMVAFIVDVPKTIMSPATVLPVQIFNWARNPESGFADQTAAAIVVLLVFLMALNWGAVIIRKRFEHRW